MCPKLSGLFVSLSGTTGKTGLLVGLLACLLVGLLADFDWQDMQDWQGAGQK